MAEDIGELLKTKIPGLDEAADIQAAFKLYHYGDPTYETTNTVTSNLVANSVAGHIQSVKNRVQVLEELGSGSDYLASAPTSAPDGFIWLDSSSSSGDSAIYSSAIYSSTEPTTGLVDGIIWVDKSSTPPLAKIYNSSTSSWDLINPLPALVDNAGDLVYASSDNVLAKLPIGSNGQSLKVASGLPAWVSEKTWTLKGTGDLSGTGFSVSGLNGDKIFIGLHNWSHNDGTDSAMLSVRFNDNAGPNYISNGGVTASSSLKSPAFDDATLHDIGITVDLANTASILKPVSTIASTVPGQYFGYYRSNEAITSVQVLLSPSGTFDSGTYEVWSYE